MCPIDPTPHGGEILHLPPRKFPPPQPGGDTAAEPDMAQRPPLPDQPEQMAVDVEDEEADPVVDSGPGIDDGR